MADIVTTEQLQNASLDTQTLEAFVNGDENTIVTTRTGNTYPSIERAINIMFQNGGLPATPFATQYEMESSAMPDGSYAVVTDSTNDATNGLYRKTPTGWVYSKYNPYEKLKSYVDENRLATLLLRDNAVLEFDVDTNNLLIPANTAVLIGKKNYELTQTTLSVPTTTQRLVYDLEQNKLITYPTKTDLSAKQHLIGYTWRLGSNFSGFGFDWRYKGVSQNKTTDYAIALNTEAADLNFVTSADSNVLNVGLMRLSGIKNTYLVNAQTVTIPILNNSKHRIEYSVITKKVQFTDARAELENGVVVFGHLTNIDNKLSVSGIDKYQINGVAMGATPVSFLAANPDTISFDFYADKITIAQGARILISSGSIITSYQELDMTKDTRWQILYFDVVSGKFGCSVINYGLQTNQKAVCMFRRVVQQVVGLQQYKLNGREQRINQNWLTQNTHVVSGDFDANYTQPTLPSWANWVDTNADYNAVYALYDQLVSSYPDYVSRTLIGKDSFDNPLYQYDFKPAEIGTSGVGETTPKAILLSSVHGGEKAGTICLYNVFKEICERWQDDTKLESLRWNCHFIVLPMVSPTGFNQNSRKNANGVDIARNFTNGWKLEYEPEHQYYGGDAPLSQPESVIVDNVLKNNRDALFFGSAHNFSGVESNRGRFIWVASGTIFHANMGKSLISRRMRQWKKTSDIPQGETFIGFASNSIEPFGTETSQAKYYGITGSVLEISPCWWWGADDLVYYSSKAITKGTEVWVNWLLLNVDKGCATTNAYQI